MTSKKNINLLLIVFYIAAFILIAYNFVDLKHSDDGKAAALPELIQPKLNSFGFVDDSLKIDKDVVKRNETLSTILSRYNVSIAKTAEIVNASKDIFDVRKIGYGKNYAAYTNKGDSSSLKYFVYSENPIDYIVFDLNDTIAVYKGEKEVTLKKKEAAGIINNSLYASLMKNEADPELVEKLAEVYAWQIDFYRIQKGDNFKVLYEEKYVDGEPVGIGDITGAYFNHNGEDFYAIKFKSGDNFEFYDENGKSLRKAFLKAPLKFSRISSHYTLRRFHPVQKRWKAHLGTDYAAPTGTPIHTVGDGVVVKAEYSRYNGNYVKVRHNGTYSTQYLHMSKIAKGIHAGVTVKQGQVIGYVGSTGLATGPHLCYRFWKNGKQVDPFKQKIPSSHPVKEEDMTEFSKVKKVILDKLNSIKIPGVMIAGADTTANI